MEKGDLDQYMTKFRHLAQMGLYQETNGKLCKDYFTGLPIGLKKSMVTMEPINQYQVLQDWVEGAIRQHQKYLQLQAYFGSPTKNNPSQCPSK